MKIKELKQIIDELDDELVLYLDCEAGRYPLQFDELNEVKINGKRVLLIG